MDEHQIAAQRRFDRDRRARGQYRGKRPEQCRDRTAQTKTRKAIRGIGEKSCARSLPLAKSPPGILSPWSLDFSARGRTCKHSPRSPRAGRARSAQPRPHATLCGTRRALARASRAPESLLPHIRRLVDSPDIIERPARQNIRGCQHSGHHRMILIVIFVHAHCGDEMQRWKSALQLTGSSHISR